MNSSAKLSALHAVYYKVEVQAPHRKEDKELTEVFDKFASKESAAIVWFDLKEALKRRPASKDFIAYVRNNKGIKT